MTLTFFIVTGLPHLFSFFFFNDTATTEIYTLSLHDALPIFSGRPCRSAIAAATPGSASRIRQRRPHIDRSIDRKSTRLNSSHQIISYAVFCLKKKKQRAHHHLVLMLRLSQDATQSARRSTPD